MPRQARLDTPGTLSLAAKGSCLLDIFVDGDGCPVKQEVYRVAKRYGLKVTLVSNSRMRTPHEDWLEIVVVGMGSPIKRPLSRGKTNPMRENLFSR